jgi:hypothetical protein
MNRAAFSVGSTAARRGAGHGTGKAIALRKLHVPPTCSWRCTLLILEMIWQEVIWGWSPMYFPSKKSPEKSNLPPGHCSAIDRRSVGAGKSTTPVTCTRHMWLPKCFDRSWLIPRRAYMPQCTEDATRHISTSRRRVLRSLLPDTRPSLGSASWWSVCRVQRWVKNCLSE